MGDPEDFGRLQTDLLYRLVQEATQDDATSATVPGESLNEYGTNAQSRHSAAASVQVKLNQRDRNTTRTWTVNYNSVRDEFQVRRTA